MVSFKLLYAFSALLLSSFASAHSNGSAAHAGLAARAVEIDSSASTLMKRTNAGLNFCSSSNMKMAFHSGAGSCSCKTACGKEETECQGPSGGHGQGACSTAGCTIVCDVGYVLTGNQCKLPACPTNQKIVSGHCTCSAPFATDYKGNCVTPPTCSAFEYWNGQDCVCKPTCGKNKMTNQCEPTCQDNASYVNGKCQCSAGFSLQGAVCVAQCGTGMEWCNDTHKCICSAGFVLSGKICVPSCGTGMEWCSDTKKCICSSGFTLVSGKCTAVVIPSCSKNEFYNPLTKSCQCDLGFYKASGSTSCTSIIPSCPTNEIYNIFSKSCECIPSCSRHPSTNLCTPVGPSQKAVISKKVVARDMPLWSSKHHTRDQDSLFCPDGLSACPISASLGGYECVDTKEELENCGGCTANGAGKDCTAIQGVSGVGCNAGRCVIFSCSESHRLSANGECLPSLFNQSS